MKIFFPGLNKNEEKKGFQQTYFIMVILNVQH